MVKILDFGLAKFIENSVMRDLLSEQRDSQRLRMTAPTMDFRKAASGDLQADAALDVTADGRAAKDARSPGADGANKQGKPLSPSADASDELSATGQVPPPTDELGDNARISSQSSSGIKGTPLYMAPEVLRGELASRRSDIYSLGALLYELCTGTPPHYEPMMTLAELRQRVSTQDPAPLVDLVPQIDLRFAAAIHRCLRRQPKERFGSIEELRETLEQIADAKRKDDVPEGNPYRGLLPFEAEHRSLFFGRKSEIGTLVDRLRTEGFLIVAADSGVGKSSVCRAGVLPLIVEGAFADGRTWEEISLVPGRRPIQALAQALSRKLGLDEALLVKILQEEPRSLLRELHKKLGDAKGLVLFVDQLEELATISDRAEAALVGEALAGMAERATNIRLLATVRSDFLARLASVPGLGDEINRTLYILRPLSAEKMQEVIVGPAHKKNVSFESEALVKSIVATTAQADGGLPLLQFALAELWEVKSGDVITAQALESIGGVEGALARHADHVLSRLQTEQRQLARRMLLQLVTVEGTRSRRLEDELSRGLPQAKAALEQLVRGRLLVVRDTPEGAAFEVAHEALIRGWGTLRRWLDETAEARAVKQRLETSVGDWQRLGRSAEVLWSERQIAETSLVAESELNAKEIEFLAASRRQALGRRRRRTLALASLPLIAGCLYAGVRVLAARDLEQRIEASLHQGRTLFAEAQQKAAALGQLQAQAYKAFDDRKRDEAESLWEKALKLSAETDRLYARSAQSLEAALSLDHKRPVVRDLMADALYARAVLAESEYELTRTEDLLQRMSLYDTDATRLKRWVAPAHLSIDTVPTGTQVWLGRYIDDERGRKVLQPEKQVGVTPLPELTLEPGSYRFTLKKEGYAETYYPVLLKRGETLKPTVPLLLETKVPKGFVYIPPGRFVFGATGLDTLRKRFFNTAPAHEIWLHGYLISRTELTYADYIPFLESLPKEKLPEYLPKVGSSGLSGMVELTRKNAQWVLTLQPTTVVHTQQLGDPIIYQGRDIGKNQNWRNVPVSGINVDQLTEYYKWLHTQGKISHARLCTENEWERAARGADARNYPHGLDLLDADANIDATYSRRDDAKGPDEVGQHLATRSPFSLDDLTRNVFEFVTSSLSSNEIVLRGGGFSLEHFTARIDNRNVVDSTIKQADFGTRTCADILDAK